MDRRDFLKIASMAGLGVAASTIPFASNAGAAPYTGKFWVMIHAGGGWDVTSHCDPKGATGENDPDPMNHYLASTIGTAVGSKSKLPMRYAPDPAGANKAFFDKYVNDLVVLNGVDTSTNSHDVGTRVTWAGTLAENKASFAALAAAVAGGALPMAYISYGGYDTTAGTVAVTRVGNIDAIRRIAYPNVIDPMYDDAKTPYYTEETEARIVEARSARHMAYAEKQNLPRIQQAMGMLFTARSGQNELKKLTEYLPTQLENSNLRRQAQIALAAYRAGICVSANLGIGGFDTHGNNDDQQFDRLAELWDGIDYLVEEAKATGVWGNMVIVVGSDFARTPGYNSGNGKDHWSITSMLAMGAGITGNQVIGKTTDRHNPMNIDPNTLEPVEGGGVRLKPGHVHRALRRLAGIDQNEVAARFPIKEKEELPLFG
ncbi:DUF1501 domain-containing protein [Polyangium sp. 6x1]|uniref:DUF1501 domain-containing protein n=1 Tax=Polyangium sp. 6x1 TaxID=3042689 RepID=UPI002482D319|nr:DUF1501 domain-containing protein [Polyangium sp. 6x1]MDI1451657.1 DUF1501 domain-containing protein [Polyangium sp. 6x1]